MCPNPTLASKEQGVFPCPDHMYDICFTIAFWNDFFIISFFVSYNKKQYYKKTFSFWGNAI